MSTQTRILVPLDFDEASPSVLDYAVRLARKMDAALDVVHVWEPPRLAGPDLLVYVEVDGQPRSLADYSQDQAKAFLSRLLGEHLGLEQTEALLLVGSPAAELMNLAQRGNYDLIVMGTRGRAKFSRLVLGSVAEKVVRLAPCSVLVVPEASERSA